LLAWQKAHQLVLGIYGFTKSFPCDEQYRLSIQLRRAADFIPANIAEGFPKRGKAGKPGS
jgi:four helix bundle protein